MRYDVFRVVGIINSLGIRKCSTVQTRVDFKRLRIQIL